MLRIEEQKKAVTFFANKWFYLGTLPSRIILVIASFVSYAPFLLYNFEESIKQEEDPFFLCNKLYLLCISEDLPTWALEAISSKMVSLAAFLQRSTYSKIIRSSLVVTKLFLQLIHKQKLYLKNQYVIYSIIVLLRNLFENVYFRRNDVTAVLEIWQLLTKIPDIELATAVSTWHIALFTYCQKFYEYCSVHYLYMYMDIVQKTRVTARSSFITIFNLQKNMDMFMNYLILQKIDFFANKCFLQKIQYWISEYVIALEIEQKPMITFLSTMIENRWNLETIILALDFMIAIGHRQEKFEFDHQLVSKTIETIFNDTADTVIRENLLEALEQLDGATNIEDEVWPLRLKLKKIKRRFS